MELLPRSVSADPDGPRVLDIEGDDAGEAFEALTSETARRILAVVYEDPATPTEVREEVGTSLQNVHYHLERLESADLIEPAGTGYSEKGNEMTVYAPTSEALVLFAGGERHRSRLQRILDRVFALVSGLSLTAVALDYLLSPRGATEGTPLSYATGTEDAGPTVDTTAQGDKMADGAEAVRVAADGGGIDPVLLFFLGGLLAVCLLTAWWVRSG